MGTIEREVHGQFPRYSGRHYHRKILFLVPAIWEGNFARSLEVSDEQAITQAMKALWAGQLL
jgi:hypothetical protein